MNKPRPIQEVFYFIMKITLAQLLLMVILTSLVSAGPLRGQGILERKVSLDVQGGQIKAILSEIEKQTSVTFTYRPKLINSSRRINFKVTDAKLVDVLNLLFGPTISFLAVDEEQEIVLRPNLASSGLPPEAAGILALTVSGVVTDEKGELLPGVNVIEKGTTNGTATDDNGKFSLNVQDESSILVFSFIGFAKQEVNVGNRVEFAISLQPDVQALDEVVVVGYGTQKMVTLTGAVSSIDGEKLSRRQVGQTSMALQGIAPGVVVTQRSGQPGNDGGTISIRGKTTLGNNSPLVLVDGIEMPMGINNLDPTLIKSISILKDAASASIYGSRAANGVILVTTKRAEEGKLSVSYNGYVGWQQPTDLPDMVGAIDHMVLTNEAYVNVGRSPLYSDAYIQEYRENMDSNPDRYPDTDWYAKLLTGNGLMQSHFLTMNGGTEKVGVLAAFGYLDQNGIIPNTSLRRYTFRINTDLKITKSFSSQIDAHINETYFTEPSRGTGAAIHGAGSIPATQTGVLSNGSWGEGWNGDNPIAFSNDGGLNTRETPSFTLNMVLKYQPVKWLNLDFAYSPNYYQSNSSRFEKAIQTYRWDGSESYKSPQTSTLNSSHERNLHNNIRSTMTVDKNFRDHTFKLLLGYQQEDFRSDLLSGYREKFPFSDYTVLNAGGEENQKAYGEASETALQSFFGRLNYDFKEKYLFEANVRYDGSSRFAVGYKWGVFPSVSGGWRISEEDFFNSLRPIVNNLKIRASWGQLGNELIGSAYPFSSSVNLGLDYPFSKKVVNGAGITNMANTGISWETTTASNIGLDIMVLDRLTLNADYYYKLTNDILINLDVPLVVGMNAPEQNAGRVENRGWDLGMNYLNWDGGFKYEIGFNISDVKNKILDLKGVNLTGLTVDHEGYPLSSIYGLQADGFITAVDFNEDGSYKHASQYGTIAPGDIKYVDQNGDNIINGDDYKVIGATIPRFTFGFDFNAQYKNFDLGVLLQGVGEADGLLRDQGIMPFNIGGTIQEQHKDRWTSTNTDATFPRFAFDGTNNAQTSTFWMRNAAYVRLKNFQIGYSLPLGIRNGIKVEKLRFYLSAQNIFTLDKFWDGYDVEAPVGSGGYYPQVKTYSLGVDVKL